MQHNHLWLFRWTGDGHAPRCPFQRGNYAALPKGHEPSDRTTAGTVALTGRVVLIGESESFAAIPRPAVGTPTFPTAPQPLSLEPEITPMDPARVSIRKPSRPVPHSARGRSPHRPRERRGREFRRPGDPIEGFGSIPVRAGSETESRGRRGAAAKA